MLDERLALPKGRAGAVRAGMVARAMLAALFPKPVVTVVATAAMWQAPLRAEEERCVARASRARRREFAAGRACARLALTRLGLPQAAILPDRNRVPCWPAGVVGSLAHCPGYCAVALARDQDATGLGLDVERAGRIGSRLLARIASPAERAALAALPSPPPGGPDWATLLFSAKESTYKCYFPLTRRRLGFRDVEVQIDPDSRGFRAHLVRADAPAAAGARCFIGHFAGSQGLLATGVFLGPGCDA